MIKWLKSLFHKKENKIKVIEDKRDNKMDLSQYKMKLNVKSICYFEKISGKSFFNLNEADILHLLYATFLINNPDTNITLNVFVGLMEINENISKWMIEKYQSMLSVIYQFNEDKEDNKDDKFTMENTHTMTDFATSLVIDYGMDVRYVMYEMDIWEFPEYYEAVNTHIKREMEMERFWTYIKVLPHIDGKKCKSPEALVPFDWERETKKKKQNQDLENNRFAIMNMIGKNIFGEKAEKDGIR